MPGTMPQTCRRKPRRTPLAIAMASAISLAALPGVLLAESEQDTHGSTEVAEPGDARLQELTSEYRELEERHVRLGNELERANSALDALEQRLADSESEREALESRLSEAQQRHDQAEEAIAAARAEAEQARAVLDDVRAQRQSVEAERDSLQQELVEARDELEAREEARQARQSDMAALEERAGGLEEDLAQLREETDAELTEIRTERDALHAELTEVRTERDGLNIELAESRSERDVLYRDTVLPLQAEVEQLRAQLPSTEGGALDLDSAQAAASEQASRLRAAHEVLRRGRSDADDPQAEYDAMVEDLRREQSLVTRVQGGTLYTVQSGETLGDVARRYYGDANRWPTIYEANQHIIENPDRVVPGLTVILP